MPDQQRFQPGRLGPFNLGNRLLWSWKGGADAWRNESSFRSWVYANVLSDLAAFVLPLSATERLVIVVLGILVLAAELMNTAIERLADLVEPAEHAAIRACKDAGSAAVAVTAIAGGVAWVLALAG